VHLLDQGQCAGADWITADTRAAISQVSQTYHLRPAFGAAPVPGARRDSSDTFSPGTVAVSEVDDRSVPPSSGEAQAFRKTTSAESKTT